MLNEELMKTNKIVASILDSIEDAFFVLDHDWRVIYINSEAERLASKTAVEVLGKVFWEVIPQTKGTILETNYKTVMETQVSMKFEVLSVNQKDTWYEVFAYPSIIGLSVYYHDITKRKLTFEKLEQSQSLYNEILESISDCFVALDKEYKILYANKVAIKLLGNEEILGKIIFDVMYYLNPIAKETYFEVMKSRSAKSIEIYSDYFSKWFEINYFPSQAGLSVYFKDITDRKNMEEEFARLDRLHLVGQMAAGIGHEIRNPMTTVRGFLQILGTKKEYIRDKQTFDLMISELDRANWIITEFLALAKIKPTERHTQNLNDILESVYPLIEADTFNQNKHLIFIPGEIPDLLLNSKEIIQMVLNLTRNGLEAMEVNGRLTIKTYMNDKVILLIEDEGCGISPDNIKKLGMPFFTTKGNGTGLGLATCYRIADAHNASITIESSSKGTKFFVAFNIPAQVSIEENN